MQESIRVRRTALREAMSYAHSVKWVGTRHERKYLHLLDTLGAWLEAHRVFSLDEITKPILLAYAASCRAEGNAESTIAWKLAALGTVNREAFEVGLTTREKLPRIKASKKHAPKWWLKPETKDTLVAALRRRNEPTAHLMADYVEFVCSTGLRVEEALRLERKHFRRLGTGKPAMFVPGTKTEAAAAWLPLGAEPAEIAVRRFGEGVGDTLFPISYGELSSSWASMCKPIVDPEGEHPTATLRALRRTFGWYATQKKMPTAVLQKFYRHTQISTTVGYLNLIGSSDVETLRAFL